jgi:protein TonB
MFDDFQPSLTGRESRARFRRSMIAAIVFYGSSGAAVIGASNTVRKAVEEELTRVEFAPPPEPEPEPPPPPPQAAAPAPSPRPKVKRPELAPPDKVSDEKLKESDKPLTSSGEGGPVDGFLDGTPGGTGNAKPVPPPAPPPPPPRVEPLIAPVEASGNEHPKYPALAKRKEIEGTVVVTFDVLENGAVSNPQIVSGPEELRDAVLKVVLSWHFRPANRGGKPVRFRMKRSIVFRLEDA